MSARTNVLSGMLLLASASVLAADDRLPDEELLEYLGSWEESDEDWLMFERESKKKRRSDDSEADAKAEEKESAETEDES